VLQLPKLGTEFYDKELQQPTHPNLQVMTNYPPATLSIPYRLRTTVLAGICLARLSTAQKHLDTTVYLAGKPPEVANVYRPYTACSLVVWPCLI